MPNKKPGYKNRDSLVKPRDSQVGAGRESNIVIGRSLKDLAPSTGSLVTLFRLYRASLRLPRRLVLSRAARTRADRNSAATTRSLSPWRHGNFAHEPNFDPAAVFIASVY